MKLSFAKFINDWNSNSKSSPNRMDYADDQLPRRMVG